MDCEICLCNPDARRQLCSIFFLGRPVRRPGVPCIGYLSNTTGTTSKEPAFRGGWLRSLRHLLEFRRHYREGGAFITERVAPAGALVPSVLGATAQRDHARSEEHTSELQSLMRISYAVFCFKKKKKHTRNKQ